VDGYVVADSRFKVSSTSYSITRFFLCFLVQCAAPLKHATVSQSSCRPSIGSTDHCRRHPKSISVDSTRLSPTPTENYHRTRLSACQRTDSQPVGVMVPQRPVKNGDVRCSSNFCPISHCIRCIWASINVLRMIPIVW